MSGRSESRQCTKVTKVVLLTLADVQDSLNLSRQTGNDPALVGLLRVYKNYYPEVIVGDATKGKAAPFKVINHSRLRWPLTDLVQHPDPQWRARLDEIQATHRQRSQEAQQEVRDGFRVNHNINGRGHRTIVPALRTTHAHEVCFSGQHCLSNSSTNLDRILLRSRRLRQLRALPSIWRRLNCQTSL